MRRRLASSIVLAFVGAAVLLLTQGAAVRADDDVDSRALRIRLTTGVTYRYRLTESSRIRVRARTLHPIPMAVSVPANDEVEWGRESTWEVGITPTVVRENGPAELWLFAERWSGRDYLAGVGKDDALVPIKERKFDSEDARLKTPSPICGRSILVRVRPDGTVVEASVLLADRTFSQTAEARTLAQRLFQVLPDRPVKDGLEWQVDRSLSPEFGDQGQRTEERIGSYSERATMGVPTTRSVKIALTCDGIETTAKRLSFKRASPQDGGPESYRRLTGTVSILRATGLVETRETTLDVHRIVPGAEQEDGRIGRDEPESIRVVTKLELIAPK